MAVVRYAWMFRTAAVVHLFFGAAFVWKYGFTGYGAGLGQLGSALGVLSLVVGVFLFRPATFAILLSAIAAAFVAVSAAVAAPVMSGLVILAFAGIALVCGIYAVMAARVLFEPGS